MRMVLKAAGVLATLTLASSSAAAQSAQRFSFQFSGLYASLYGGDFDDYGISDGTGFEGQLRFTPGAFSLGAGVQHTSHNSPGGAIFFDDGTAIVHDEWSGTLFGFFLEPRYVIATRSTRLAPYLSARLSMLTYEDESDWVSDDGSVSGTATTKTDGLTVNGGGGLLIRLGQRVNADLGVTYGYSNFDEYRFVYRASDSSVDFTAPAGTGSNVVVRFGLAIGIGG